jgi:hypothetical protein
MVKISSVHRAPSPQSRPTRSAAIVALTATLQLIQQPTDRARGRQLARSPRLTHVTGIAVGVTPASALIVVSAPTHLGALERAIQHNTNRHDSRPLGAPMEFIERSDDGPEPISIARCRELLGEEAESMTDQEIALIRRHAEMMACIVVEIYQEGSRIPE